MRRMVVVLVLAVVGLLFASSHFSIASAQTPAAWQDKVDPAVLEAAALGEADFIVYMADRADLSGAAAISGKLAKGTYVYNQLTATAQQSQSVVTTVLTGLGATYRPFWVVNALSARGNLAAIEAVASLNEVAYLYANTASALTLPPQAVAPARTPSAIEPSIALVRAPEAWAQGASGQGVVIAGADTGVFWEHETLQGQYRGWNGTEADHNYNWHDAIPVPNGFCPGNSPQPCDDDELLGGGHGTHTMGTMLGTDGGDNQIGMAPAAQWIACRNMNYGVGVVATYMDCLEWFLAPTDLNDANPDVSKSPHVINNSWGCLEGCPPEILRDSVAALRAAGIVYVASAGNDGPECSTIEFPTAIYPESFTVGATDINDVIADFSSRGPVLSLDPLNPILKPNISAPGVDVRSAVKNGGYSNLSGTSMAGPHVAGLVALVISANPDLAGEVDAIEDIIERTAVPLTTTQACGGDSATAVPNNVYGHGRIDALAAVLAAREAPTSVQLGGVGAQTGPGAGVAVWLAGALLAATGLTLLLRRNRRA